MTKYLRKIIIQAITLMVVWYGFAFAALDVNSSNSKPLFLLKALQDEEKEDDILQLPQKVQVPQAPVKRQQAPRKTLKTKPKQPKLIARELESRNLDEIQADMVRDGTIRSSPRVLSSQITDDQSSDSKINALNNKSDSISEREVKRLTPNIEKIVARFESNSVGAVVTFLWSSPVKAVSFIKNNKLWLIFDKHVEIEFRDFSSQTAGFSNITPEKLKIYNIEQYHIDNKATYVVADISLDPNNSDFSVTLSKYRENWVLEVSKQYSRYMGIPLFVRPLTLPTPTIELMLERPISSIINYNDPFTGNMMSVVPVDVEGKRIDVEYKFVDLSILHTIQGVAIEKIADDVQVMARGSSLFITSESGLSISHMLGDYGVNAIDDVHVGKHSLLDFSELPNDHFLDGYQFLHESIINCKASIRPIAKLNMALFYLKHRMYPEAIAYVKMAQNESGLIKMSYRASLISAVANYMYRRYDVAYEIIDFINIDDVPIVHRQEIMFWKAIIAYKIADSYKYLARSNTINLFENHQANFMETYPVHILSKIGFDILGDKIDNKSVEMAQKVIKVLQTFHLPETDLNRLYSDMGVLYSLQNKFDASLETFDKCIATKEDYLHYAKCSWLKSKLLYQQRKISWDKFVDHLERLRMVWRGSGVNNLEMNILKDLYHTYNEQKQLLQVLRIGQVVLDNYPNTIDALRLTGNMSKLFIGFFLAKNQSNTPLQKLELFYEFRNLLPIGHLGDEIILVVADCLIELDLLNKASDLLEHQVRNRLVGMKKERAINKLMHIYIYNDNPKEALNIMSLGISYNELPEGIAKERKYMHANALYASGKSKEAIELLKDDYSLQADDVKMRILWLESNWKDFNDYSEPYIYSIRFSNKQLTSSDIIRLLKQSIAYILSNEISLFNQLYEDFKMRLPEEDKHTNMIKLLYEMSQNDRKVAMEIAKNINNTKKVTEDFLKISDEDI